MQLQGIKIEDFEAESFRLLKRNIFERIGIGRSRS